MRSPASAFQTAIQGDQWRPIWLLELRLSTGTLRYAINPVDVTFNALTYTAVPASVGAIQESAERQAPQVRVRLQNVDGVLGPLVDALNASGADPRTLRAVVTMVEASNLADATAKIEDTLVIDSVTISREAVEFILGSPFATGILVPLRAAGSYTCPWEYKGAHCGSESPEKSCGKTLADCRLRFPKGDALRFGGLPGRVTTRRTVLV